MKIQRSNSGNRGFTLVELVVVIVVLGVLAAALLPALAGTKVNDQAFRCLNNTRQLALGWELYAQDNADVMVASIGWVAGSMNGAAPGSPWTLADSTNVTKLTDPSQASMARYVKSPAVFKCPSDKYQSANNPVPRVRSYSMNVGVGGKFGTIGGTYNPDDPTNPRTYLQNTMFQRTSILNKPGPAKVWVFLDEHPDSISDSAFQFQPGWVPTGYVWQDLPGSLHDGGCSISFADGHCMIKKWADSRTTQPIKLLYKWWQGGGSTFPVGIPNPSVDYAWMNSGIPYR
jgi:prepilin-type N-terminal cleavage/methylation domain-containing protein/prepilin-type processing-associated H-X9-DG protein